MSKLYIVTRSDLAAGAQVAQSTHAAVAFVLAHPELSRSWNAESNNLVIVTARDEGGLRGLLARASAAAIPSAEFHEPDFGDELTAIALFGDAAGRLVSSLPLALRAPRAA